MEEVEVFITRTKYDPPTGVLFPWSNEIIEFLKMKGITHKVLDKERVTRKNIDGLIEPLNPRLIVFNGHGDNDEIYGHKDEVIIKVGENTSLLDSKIVYARTCFAADGVGAEFKNMSSDSCFIGYSDFYYVVSDDKHATRPHLDPLTKPARLSSNKIILEILKGKTVKESLEESKKIMLDYAKIYAEMKGFPEYIAAARFMKHNIRHQVSVGNENTTFR